MEPVLVTGGSGFIGRHLVRTLLRERRLVAVLDKHPIALNEVRFIQVDLSESRALPIAARSYGKIVHLAAEVSVVSSTRNPWRGYAVNVGGTLAMLEHARRIDASRFVYASTAAVYGNRSRAAREEDLPHPRSPYAASKLAGEYYCQAYTELYGLPTIILRFFNVYGPGQSNAYAGVISQMTRRALQGKPPIILGDGLQSRDFIFVQDVVDAVAKSLEAKLDPGTVLNVGMGKATNIRHLARVILRRTGTSQLHPVYAPARAGDVKFSQASVSAARRAIGFKPRYDLERGLAETVEWFRTKTNL